MRWRLPRGNKKDMIRVSGTGEIVKLRNVRGTERVGSRTDDEEAAGQVWRRGT